MMMTSYEAIMFEIDGYQRWIMVEPKREKA